MWALALVAASLAAEAQFEKVDEADGVVLESRGVPGSPFEELRAITTTTLGVEALCRAAFDESKGSVASPEIKARQVLKESPDERVVYDQIAAPMVSDRDYAFRVWREHHADGSCTVRFATANELAPPLKPGFVRMAELRGAWTFTRAGDKTQVAYVIHTDPGGSLPGFVVKGGSRKAALRSVKQILEKSAAP